jgi:hypothetical protein
MPETYTIEIKQTGVKQVTIDWPNSLRLSDEQKERLRLQTVDDLNEILRARTQD